jgi:poly-gamma-glutamate system protein
MVLAAGLFYWAENSRVLVKQPHYDLKLQAAEKMVKALEVIRQDRASAGWALDEVNDPNQSALIGLQYSIITTDEGDLGAKLTTTNPNYVAVILEMLMEAGVDWDDKVACAFTGSFPALNIAVIIACETLGAEPVIVTSVGSSMWGANQPDFTYLDMESILIDHEIIQHRSIAASIGGGEDIGRSISQAGRMTIEEAILRNGIPFIKVHTIQESREQRRSIYKQFMGNSDYEAFINVGGGLAVLGHEINGQIIPPGLNKTYLQRNYPTRGLIHEFWERGLPIIHLQNVNEIARQYGLPLSPVPLPPVGSGEIFAIDKYNLSIAWFAVLVLFGVLLAVLFLDRDKYKLKQEGVDPDTLI